jgi:hypothetical protein
VTDAKQSKAKQSKAKQSKAKQRSRTKRTQTKPKPAEEADEVFFDGMIDLIRSLRSVA